MIPIYALIILVSTSREQAVLKGNLARLEIERVGGMQVAERRESNVAATLGIVKLRRANVKDGDRAKKGKEAED